MSGARWVYEYTRNSILEKRFQRSRLTGKTAAIDIRHHVIPADVVADLRNGCLKSLAWYLEKHKAIPDSAVALELWKALRGQYATTPYRLIVIRHPDAPETRGRPKSKPGDRPTSRQLKQALAYRARIAQGDKPEHAAEFASKNLKTSPGAIFRAHGLVIEYELFLDESKAAEERRLARLAILAELNDSADKALAALRSRRRVDAA